MNKMMDKKYLIFIVIVLILFGNKILPPQLATILSHPVIKYSLIYVFINNRVKNYYHALYITLFVMLCFSIVNYLEKPSHGKSK